MLSMHNKEGFEALIKPITDFNKIEIDLCRSLEEYMSHIHRVEAKPSTFAEAALLVQNSAAIYSKKVDSLWTSVLQLLEGLRKNTPTCRSCGGTECTSTCLRTKRKNRHSSGVNASNESDEEEAGGAAGPRKKRVPTTAAAMQDFLCIDNVCTERSLDINLNKFKKSTKNNNKQIVLNVAMKVITDHNVTSNVYDALGDTMGRKDEFKLHWKMTSIGILHEDFVNNHSKNRRKEGGCVDDSIDDMIVDSVHTPCNDFPPCDDHFENHNESIFPTPPQNSEDVPMSEFIAEDEILAGAQRMSLKKEHVVTVEDLAKKAWEPIPFDFNMPEKPARKVNVIKVPDSLQNKSRKENLKRRRELIEINFQKHSFLTVDGLVEKYLKADQLDKFLCQYELLKSVQAENQLRKKMLSRRKKAYQELVIREAAKEFEGDFGGFPDMDPDSDDDGGGFNGFDVNANNFVADNINVPLPDANDHVSFHDAHDDAHNDDLNKDYDFDKETPEVNTFEAEALKTLQEYQLTKIQEEEKRLSGLNERVAAWHQLIKPRLEEAERTKHFDIHEYGSRILDKFPKNSTNPKDNVKLFAEIVAGEPKGEVARNFLTTLCLANTNNLELTKTNPDKMAMDCLQLRLLSRTRHHEEMHQMMQNGK